MNPEALARMGATRLRLVIIVGSTIISSLLRAGSLSN
jgi:hypothetical protein